MPAIDGVLRHERGLVAEQGGVVLPLRWRFRRARSHRGSMTMTPRNTPMSSTSSSTSTKGASQLCPKNSFRVTLSWLFSAKAKRTKKMAALSSHMRYFKTSPQVVGDDCSDGVFSRCAAGPHAVA